MNGKGHGQLRRSQVITTFGPGALIDLPNDSAIVGGLDTWGSVTNLESIDEPRLSAKLTSMTGVPNPRLYAPPPEPESWQDRQRGIGAWRFPEWFVVQESGAGPGAGTRSSTRSRRMVPRTALTNGRYDKKPVVATRFVRACSKGHVDDIDWYQFVHGPDDPCRRRLWLDERGTSGDLVEQIVRCECGRSRRMHEAVDFASFPLGVCRGARPWLGRHANEECREPSRLLIRTASNAWFPQVVSVLSLPDRDSEVDRVVEVLWDRLQIVNDANALAVMKNFPDVANSLAPFSDQEVLDAIAARSSGGAAGDRPIKHAELDALLAVPEGYGDDAPSIRTFALAGCRNRSGATRHDSTQSKPSFRFTGCGRCWRWLGSRDWNRSCRTWTASTTAKSSAPQLPWSRRGFRRWRTAAKGSWSSFEPMR